MKSNSKIKRRLVRLSPGKKNNSNYNRRPRILRRLFVSGLASIFLILVIIYTLPMTVLSVSSLIEYAIIVAMVVFLLILLLRYFGILILAYLSLNEYTFKKDSNFSPFVSIIIPVYNEGKIIRKVIESLLRQKYSNFEIIVVNDGSTDDTREIVESMVGYQPGRSREVKVTLINKENSGKANSLNAGINCSEADYILCMDGDSELSENCLRKALRHFVNDEIGAVAGNVKVQNRGTFLTDLQALEYIEGLNMARSAQSYIKLVNIIPGPVGIFRREAIEDAGMYTSDTFAEDADLTLRIMARGWKIIYEPKAISYTEAPVELQQLLKQRYRWTRGILQSIRKHKKLMINPTKSFGNTFILWTMFFEALIWPSMNIAANLFFIVAALAFGFTSLIFYWWAGLALLDLITAIYCLASEGEDFRLVSYSIIYRMVFILLIDICKAMSTIEEFLGIRMKWGKLKRAG
ncbi:MAG: glycosyltransferase [Ignavibacteria bacterium]|jgi:poly-beta-1,6 N-acetyl-D-glucosamine synthase